MTDSNVHPADLPFFSATLHPHRSLGRRGFLILMGAIAAVAFATGLVFYRIGAWPVAGFCGLDVGLIWLAFHLNYRSARAFETLAVSRTEVAFTRVAPSGAAEHYRFNPLWVRLEVTRIEDEGVTRIALVSHGRAVPVGGFLNPDDRGSLAVALRTALATARTGLPAA